jgi:uncharacterized protein (DUF362 family)
MKRRLPLAPDPEAAVPAARGLTRRQLLQVAATLGLSASAVAAGLALHGRDANGGRPPPARLRDHRVPAAAGAVELAIARGPDAADNVRRAVEALGGMAAFVRPGDRVLIKPNVGWNRLPDQAANTQPEVVAQVVKMVRAAGAARVWVSDFPVNNPERCFERSGIRAAVGAAGGDLVLPDGGSFRDVEVGGHVVSLAEVIWPLVDADKVINLPVVKQHGLSRATLGMKNWYGVVGGHRARMHQAIHRAIVDLAAFVRPTLTILDGTRALVANGPSGGSLDDVRRLDTVAAAVDPVALDAFGASLLGLAPADVGFIVEAEKAGLGRSAWRSLKVSEVGG